MKKIAIPTVDELLSNHFGHCEKFAIVEINDTQILSLVNIDPPVHKRGSYPYFLAKQGVDVIISGGMGTRALELFARHNIEVYLGVPNESPQSLVKKYLHDQLDNSRNLCDHNDQLKQCLLESEEK